ncbi:MAG: DUF3334 family protein [Desulfamplus sp.]|nr:DUF3334 family protein [Desulfamplus sp.]
MTENNIQSTDDILIILCNSVTKVLTKASGEDVSFSPIVQKISKTCLKPDISCFTIFEGGLSGLLIMNFTAEAAMEIYTSYMINMGMPKEELSILHTSDDVANVLGELMSQTMGRFQTELRQELQVSIKLSLPKMLVINKDVVISIDTKIETPQFRRVSFETENHRPFFLELGIEKTEFETLFPFEKEKEEDVEEILLAEQKRQRLTKKIDWNATLK